MTFPLKAWIDDHAGAPHHLSHSGMGGILHTYDEAIARPEVADELALRDEVARMVGVPSARLFLTHGATEANALVLGFLAERGRRAGRNPPRCAFLPPEYPPLTDAARWVGLDPVPTAVGHDVAVASSPANPTGLTRSEDELRALADRGAQVVIDETFRQFTERRSLAARGDPRVWALGSFTKAFGGDDLRIGYVATPVEEADPFEHFHSVVLDDIPDHSVRIGRALLRDQERILAEVREIFGANLETLRRHLDRVPDLAAPVHFDRGQNGLDGDGLAKAALQAGVLVCPGSFFGDPTGVRVCLTQRTFARDLAAYLAVRERFTDTG